MKMHNAMFTPLEPGAAEHFKIYFYATMARVLEQVVESFDSLEAACEEFPFLAGYYTELVHYGMETCATIESTAWQAALRTWESRATMHLPLRALRETAALNHAAMTLLVCIGLIEEDARFGLLFENLQCAPNQPRPTLGLLSAWWRAADSYDEARANIKQLLDLGLITIVNGEAPRSQWAFQPQAILWEALRGEPLKVFSTWGRFCEPQAVARLDDLILPAPLKQKLAAIPKLLAAGEVQALIIRGAQHNGRRTLLSAIAQALGRGVLELRGLGKADDERWRMASTLATLLKALPVANFDLAPGETVELPALPAYQGGWGFILGKQGGLSGETLQSAISLTLEMPDISARQLHWQRALGLQKTESLDLISERFRAT